MVAPALSLALICGYHAIIFTQGITRHDLPPDFAFLTCYIISFRLFLYIPFPSPTALSPSLPLGRPLSLASSHAPSFLLFLSFSRSCFGSIYIYMRLQNRRSRYDLFWVRLRIYHSDTISAGAAAETAALGPPRNRQVDARVSRRRVTAVVSVSQFAKRHQQISTASLPRRPQRENALLAAIPFPLSGTDACCCFGGKVRSDSSSIKIAVLTAVRI